MSDQIQPWPVVKQGSHGHPVPALQYLLRDRGHHVTVDGIFGPKTEAAVEQFQIADQLHIDGIVGPQTWGALVIVLGLGGGVLVSRDVSRNISGLSGVIEAVRGGDLRARVAVRGTRDEYDELAAGLNDMLDRLERSIGGLRHAGDAIAHDLRSPLTRLRSTSVCPPASARILRTRSRLTARSAAFAAGIIG